MTAPKGRLASPRPERNHVPQALLEPGAVVNPPFHQPQGRHPVFT